MTMTTRTFLLSTLLLLAGCLAKRDLGVVPGAAKDPRWQRIDSLDALGQYATALQMSNDVLQQAMERGDQLEEFRAWMHTARFQTWTGSEVSETMALLSERAANAPEPLRSLLHGVMGSLLWDHYQEERWSILQRTNTADDPTDMETWGQQAYMRAVIDHFQASLMARDTLMGIPVQDLGELMEPGDGEVHLRPTLYDLLAHRALEVFTNSETRIAEPASRFTLSGERFFELFDDFTTRPLVHPDSSAWEFQAIRLYQDLARSHINDTRPDAYVDVELARLAFVRERSTAPDRDSLYLRAITTLRSRVPKDSCWSEVTHAMAEWHHQQADKYQRLGGEDYKYENSVALELCREGIARFPGSFGARRCAALEARILEERLRLTVEEAVRPGRPFKVLVEHRNVPQVWWRMHPWSVALDRDPDPSRKDVEQLLKQKAFRAGSRALPDHNDLNTHLVELPFEALDTGYYVLLLSSSPEFRLNKDNVQYAVLHATGLGVLERELPDRGVQLFVMDRNTGVPVPKATVRAMVLDHRSDDGQRYRQHERSLTDADGRVEFPLAQVQGAVRYEVAKGSDRLVTPSRYHYVRRTREQEERTRTFLFTDRAIYRPGQPIHFKGIVVTGADKQNKVEVLYRSKVTLFDVNGKKTAETEVITDAYGAFQGVFNAPTGTLTGRMELRETHGSTTVRVEEYKRPTFEVTFDPVEAGPVVGEMAEMKGRARSYSGVPVDGGSVQWRVIRTPRMPWWCGAYWRGSIPWGSSTEIANGTARTDGDGRFTIHFLAQADPSIPQAAQALFNYEVVASVTDISGESQSGSGRISVGRQRFMIDLDLADAIARSDADSLRVRAMNMNGQPLAVPIHVKVHALASPAGVPYRERLWEVPDGFVLDKSAHDSLFPEEAFADEADPLQWPISRTVLEQKGAKGPIPLKDARTWPVGDYRVELTADDGDGGTVSVSKHFVVYDPELPGAATASTALQVHALRTTVEPGGKAAFLVGSALGEATVLVEVERQGRIVSRRTIRLSKDQQKVEVPVLEEDRGGLAVHIACVERGRLHRITRFIDVPWSNKALKVEWMRFRDKLEPGVQEEWRLRITGPKGGQVAAQLLATMYDASLDHFVPHDWQAPSIWPGYVPQYAWRMQAPFGTNSGGMFWNHRDMPADVMHAYPGLNTFGFLSWRGISGGMHFDMAAMDDGGRMSKGDDGAERSGILGFANAPPAETEAEPGQGRTDGPSAPPPVVRSDLRETAFFFPDLLTDRDGGVVLRFRTPEALTRWKVLGLAHTTELQFARFEGITVTQRPLMVVPNLPRFLRAGDRIVLSAKVQATEKRVEGPAVLELFDPFTNAPLDKRFGLDVPQRMFIAAPGESAVVEWEVRVPEGVDAVAVRITVRGGGGPVGGATYADGEERVLPVLTDRVLVTESLPLPVNGEGTREFSLKGLLESGASPTLRQQNLKLEFTPNPAWYAVQALPYLMEFPHDCAEQIFSRYYANRLATHITEEQPAIKAVFEEWRQAGPEAFLSALEKNSALKGIVLEETPWLMDAADERERRERIAVLFDLQRMSREEAKTLRELIDMQRADGSWGWFNGMAPSRSITQHIVAGMGHLDALGAADLRADGEVQRMLRKAVQWLDDAMYADFEKLRARSTPEALKKHRPGYLELQYLYARSFHLRLSLSAPTATMITYYRQRFAAEWLSYGLQEQAMIALMLERFGERTTPELVLTSLRQRATVDEELGMYWKAFRGGMERYAFPVETHALLIEAFQEVAKDKDAVDRLRTHLLQLKRTTDWGTTMATAEAVHALLLGGEDWLTPVAPPIITVGGETIDPSDAEAGTGYFEHAWPADSIVPGMGRVTVTSTSDRASWGALHWQYLERMDRVSAHESPFSLKKQVMLKQTTEAGPVLVSLEKAAPLKVGNEVVVRVELRTDRWLDFVHLKDLRGAGLEPLESLSGYKYQGGLGYYQAIRDASMNFFFDRIGPGTYVFEYALRVTHAGQFSNGITTAMCMYAPEFSSHSGGLRLEVME